jgi:hypothetical protein
VSSPTDYDDCAADATAPSARPPPPTRRLHPQAVLILASQGRLARHVVETLLLPDHATSRIACARP